MPSIVKGKGSIFPRFSIQEGMISVAIVILSCMNVLKIVIVIYTSVWFYVNVSRIFFK